MRGYEAIGDGRVGIAFISQRAVALEIAQKLVVAPAIPELHFARPLFVLARTDARPSAAVLAFLALLGKGNVR